MVKKIWGIEARSIWNIESGEPFEPDDLHPAVDVVNRRLFGIRKDDEQDAVIVHSYHPTAQKTGAYNFAVMAWGKPNTWTKPDINDRIVACLGAPACASCLSEPMAAMDLATNWRVQPYEFSNEITAKRLLDPSDPDCNLTTDEHLLAQVTDMQSLDKIQAELMRRCIGLFGPPTDMATGIVPAMYSDLIISKDE